MMRLQPPCFSKHYVHAFVWIGLMLCLIITRTHGYLCGKMHELILSVVYMQLHVDLIDVNLML